MAPTFASAAAQNSNSTRDSADWSRRPNGATQTFRRTSGTPQTISSNPPQEVTSSAQPTRYVPPHRSNGTVTDTRYSKEQLLDLFRYQQAQSGGLEEGLSELFVAGWRPDGPNGSSGSAWARGEQSRDNQPGPDICWDSDGAFEPLGLQEMDDDERELFTTSVNTPLKPPANAKENQPSNGLPGGRKPSISNQPTTPGIYGSMTPSSNRGTGRRRETSESLQAMNNPLSPTGASFGRDDQRAASPPPSLIRRRTDAKDSSRDFDSEEKAASNPFGSLKRTTTNPLSTGFGSASSPWANAPQSAGLSPMGSFGNFGLGQQSTAGEKRPSMSGARAESRFKNVLNKDGSEDSSMKPVERKASMSGLSRVNENESWRPQQPQDATSALLEDEEDLPTNTGFGVEDGHGAAQAFQSGLRGLGTPGRMESQGDFGFSAFGTTSDHAQGMSQGFFQQSPGHQRQMTGNEPMSPTDTDPYRSPENHSLEMDADDASNNQLPGLGAFTNEHAQGFGALGGLGAFPNLGRAGAQGTGGDRSQTSSAGPNRGFPTLGNLGQLGNVTGSSAWPVSHGGIGTPTRQTSGLSGAFGGGIFAGGLGEVQSPGLAGLGSSMLTPQGSRMTSMFPPTTQDQLRHTDVEQIDRGFSSSAEFESLTGYGDGRQQIDRERSMEQLSAQFGGLGQQSQQPPIGQPSQQHQSPAPSQPPSSSASNQLPATQQRTMVMPDRMRWIYRDPQGQTQGPWSGLEMHDWYKAGFFSPELLVKKYEDPDYEPLAQLIRRIGNSREPFLVPQIGIPHGQPSNNGPNAWAGSGATGSTPASGGTQPPFASSFPSFGTTLTAEQQNALERRKQEEQYLMARQKEHLAQAQIAQRMQHQQQMHHAGGMQHHGSSLMPGSGQLHHHGSAQSLHSQPSMGSLASPTTTQFQASPNQGPQGQNPGFFDGAFRGTAPGAGAGLGAIGASADNLGQIREEEIPAMSERLTFGQRAGQGQFGAPGQSLSTQMPPPGSDIHNHQVQQMLEDRARLQQEQELLGSSEYEQGMPGERLQQFQQLQGKLDSRFKAESQEPSLTEQVQKAASVQQTPAPLQPGLPQPFPPAPSQSPLPAPAAQRTGRQSVADQLQTEQREISETSSLDTPSAIAPWAKEVGEASRGPSLKEIQEMEAKKAAEAEEIVTAARRAAMQKEMEAAAHAQAQAAAGPGLPASASWATGSPATPTGGNSAAWAKAAQKPTTAAAAKSMAQIQKEEEARKKKLAAVAMAAQSPAAAGVPPPTGGKSYANLASKVGPPPGVLPQAGGAWTTVGAGGKAKTPVAPVPAPARAVSSNVVPSVAAATRKAPVRSATMATAGGINAQEEFRKWATGELRPDLNKGIPAEEFVLNLVALPQDLDMITEAVHGASSTIDSRHFAEEFIRRKKLADKGLIDTSAPPKSASPHAANVDKSGGWSEVAKKGPVKEASAAAGGKEGESNGNFRVVASKKKGGKR